MSDLFADQRQSDLDRLLALGWKQLQRYGREYWEHPTTHAWHTLEQALEWLRQHDQEKQGGKTP
jgi:hypothetical protein